jgi:hypothetical protein
VEHPYREVIIDFINLIVGASDTQAESDALWAYAKVPPTSPLVIGLRGGV